MNSLRVDIKNKTFKKCYLFYGEEKYLINLFKNRIINAIFEDGQKDMNLNNFSNDFEVSDLFDAIETLPFLADKRLIIVNDSKLFTAKRKTEAEKLFKFIENISDFITIIFIEDEIDKRSKMYKSFNKLAKVIEFKAANAGDLKKWLRQIFSRYKMTIDNNAMEAIFLNLSNDMALIENEVDKLIAYKGYQGNITIDDIDKIISKSVELKIFELTDCISNKNLEGAIKVYQQFIDAKESPIMVLNMMTRQFRQLFTCKLLAGKKVNNKEMATVLSIPPFFINKLISQSMNFEILKLEEAVKDCLLCDNNIKTGKIEQNLGVEALIIKYAI